MFINVGHVFNQMMPFFQALLFGNFCFVLILEMICFLLSETLFLIMFHFPRHLSLEINLAPRESRNSARFFKTVS